MTTYHCFFEQSGTFKNEFRKLGYNAYDYDIKNDFNETDFKIDLFQEIEKAYDNKKSIFVINIKIIQKSRSSKRIWNFIKNCLVYII